MVSQLSFEGYTLGHIDSVCDLLAETLATKAIQLDNGAIFNFKVAYSNKTFIIFGQYSAMKKLTEDKMREILQTELSSIGYNQLVSFVFYLENKCGVLANMLNERRFDYHSSDHCVTTGYATNETQEYLPLGQVLIKWLTTKMFEVSQQQGSIFTPDGKCTLVIEYEDEEPKRIDSVSIALSHKPEADIETIRKEISTKIIDPFFRYVYSTFKLEIIGCFVNPVHPFISNLQNDAGCSGNKISTNLYGSQIPIQDVTLTGKDCRDIDRVATYYSRYIAKNIVAAGLADKCKVTLCFGINMPQPYSLQVDFYGTNRLPLDRINKAIDKSFSFKPAEMARELDLLSLDFNAVFKHSNFYSSDDNFKWEQTDRVTNLKRNL